MKVCYFGDYNQSYSRNVVLQKALRVNGVDVLECHIDSKGIRKYFEIYKKIRSIGDDVDVIFIGFSNSRFIWFVNLLTKKPIVWNAFFSLYDNWIYDRKLASPHSFKALYYWFLDWVCCISADCIILETSDDIEYFTNTFNISKSKFIKIILGYNEDVFIANDIKQPEKKFVVLFYGTYIPVHGVEYIIHAAKILESEKDITFKFIGRGQTYEEIRMLSASLKLQNVNFIGTVTLEEIKTYLQEADISLGLFGSSSRIDQAIPNKVFEASAMKRTSITADSRAVQEIFTNRENILLCRRADAEDLAKKILEIKNNPLLNKKIATQAHLLVNEVASTKVIGKLLSEALKKF